MLRKRSSMCSQNTFFKKNKHTCAPNTLHTWVHFSHAWFWWKAFSQSNNFAFSCEGTWNTCTRTSARGKVSAPRVSCKPPSTVTDARAVVLATAAASSASLLLQARLPTSSLLPRCIWQALAPGPQSPSMACRLLQDPLWRKVSTFNLHKIMLFKF